MHEPKRPKMHKYCYYCGAEVYGRKFYCSAECKAAGRRLQPLKRIRTQPKPKLSIDEINRLARDEGLTYGQYVAKYKMTFKTGGE